MVGASSGVGLPARELLSLIRGLVNYPDSLLARKLRGPAVDWDLTAQLLRLIELDLRGLQWQNAGGKGQRPKPIPLPDERGRGDKPTGRASGEELARRLRSMGLIPPGD